MVRIKFVWLILSCLVARAWSQDPVYTQVGVEEGLPNPTVYSLLHDPQGFLWLGTESGIYRFDGRHFLPFRNIDQRAKPLTGLSITPTGRLYAHNFVGQIFFLEGDSLHHLDSWKRGKITDLTTDGKGNLWVCTESGIFRYHPGNKAWSEIKINGQSGWAHSCHVDQNGTFGCISSQGIIQIRDENVHVKTIQYAGQKTSGEHVLAVGGNQKWVFSRVGGEVYTVKGNGFERYKHPSLDQVLAERKVNRVEVSSDNILWIFTYSGIVLHDLNFGKTEVIFPKMAFSSIARDESGAIWLGSLLEGLVRVPDLKHRFWLTENGADGDRRCNGLASADGLIYCSTFNGNIGRIDPVTREITWSGLNQVVDIQAVGPASGQKGILFSAQNTIYYQEQDLNRPFIQGLPPAKTWQNLDSMMAVGTSRGLILHDVSRNLTLDTVLSTWTRDLALDEARGTLYAATDSGVIAFFVQGHNLKPKDTLLAGVQVTFLEQQDGILWALTFNGNLHQVKDSKIEQVATLPTDLFVKQLTFAFGKLWFATNQGLGWLNPNSGTYGLFTHLDGLASVRLLGFSATDKEIWLASESGVEVMPVPEHPRRVVPTLFVSKIWVNGASQDAGRPLSVGYRDPVRIDWVASALGWGRDFQVGYRLSEQQNWIMQAGDAPFLELASLPSGELRMELQIFDLLGAPVSNPVILRGHVLPPFWQRWWFILITLLALMGSAFGISQRRLVLVRRRQIEEVKRIRLLHELRLSKETALRAQMNPHFIFNVLNSIKGFIYENDKKKAASYLQRFSDLMRRILDQSAATWVSLEEEIELLRLYIELESLSLPEDFEFQIEIDEEINPFQTLIPSLIVQPYLENAFKHGLRHKSGPKSLNLSFAWDEEADGLRCVVEDNGIGRDAASKINASNPNRHSSFATEAISRMSLWNQSQPGIISVKIVDLQDEAGLPAGTRVEILFKERVKA